MSVRRLAVVSYPRSFRTQAIRTQTQMILMVRTQATGFYVPILVRGGNSSSSTQTAFHLYLWRNIESRTGPVSCLVKGAKVQMVKRHFTHARPRVSGALLIQVYIYFFVTKYPVFPGF